MKPLLVFLFCCVTVDQAMCETLLSDAHVDNGLLSWTPAANATDVTYTVQYKRSLPLMQTKWENVPSCVRTSSLSCDVGLTSDAVQHGCVELRVRAQRRGLRPEQVDACSKHSDSCSPQVELSARYQSLTVLLSNNHSLYQDAADNAKHRVDLLLDGELLESRDSVSSETFLDLEEGRRYCVQVQYVFYEVPVGLMSCPVCDVIPESPTRRTTITVIVGVIIIVVIVVAVIATYLMIFQCGRLKQWLRPPCQISDKFFVEPFSKDRSYTYCPNEERCDTVSAIIPA